MQKGLVMNKLLDMFKDKEKMKHYALYIIFGVLTTLVDFGVYYLLINCLPSLNENFANMIGIFASIVFAYFTNIQYVFKSKEKDMLKEFMKFFISRMSSTIFNIVSFWALTTFTSINSYIVKIIISVFVVIANYVISKFFVFKEESKVENK